MFHSSILKEPFKEKLKLIPKMAIIENSYSISNYDIHVTDALHLKLQYKNAINILKNCKLVIFYQIVNKLMQ